MINANSLVGIWRQHARTASPDKADVLRQCADDLEAALNSGITDKQLQCILQCSRKIKYWGVQDDERLLDLILEKHGKDVRSMSKSEAAEYIVYLKNWLKMRV